MSNGIKPISTGQATTADVRHDSNPGRVSRAALLASQDFEVLRNSDSGLIRGDIEMDPRQALRAHLLQSRDASAPTFVFSDPIEEAHRPFHERLIQDNQHRLPGAPMIVAASDETVSCTNGNVYSFEIIDCITVFLAHAPQGSIEEIWACHISNGFSSSEIINAFFEDIPLDDIHVYLVGGDNHTRLGQDCLLVSIHKAMNGHFNNIVHEGALPIQHHAIDARLGMDGSISYTAHK